MHIGASDIIGATALLIIFGCIIWTTINKKNHPEKYKNEKGNAFNILFGNFFSDAFSNSKDDYYYKNTKYGRRHTKSIPDQFNDANAKRAEAMRRYINPVQDENLDNQNNNSDNNKPFG